MNRKTMLAVVAFLTLAGFAGCSRQGAPTDRCEGNCRDGEGAMYKPDGSKYVGHWKEGKTDGQGTSYFSDGTKIYEGQWKANNYDGQGTEYLPGGGKYVGGFKNDQKDGHGALYLPDGAKVYDGEWKDGKQVNRAAPDKNPDFKIIPRTNTGRGQKKFLTV